MKTNQKFKQIVSWLAVLVWMTMIFYLSSQTAQASNSLSKIVTSIILRIINIFGLVSIETSMVQNWVDLLNNTVREYAHGAIFFILVLFVCNAFSKSGLQGWRLYTYSFVFCMAYACLDEMHQMFVPGRGAEAKDVITDCAGAFLGLTLYGTVAWGMGFGKHKSYI